MPELNDNDLLTFEVQFKREGTLPPEKIAALLSELRLAYESMDELEAEIARFEGAV